MRHHHANDLCFLMMRAGNGQQTLLQHSSRVTPPPPFTDLQYSQFTHPNESCTFVTTMYNDVNKWSHIFVVQTANTVFYSNPKFTTLCNHDCSHLSITRQRQPSPPDKKAVLQERTSLYSRVGQCSCRLATNVYRQRGAFYSSIHLRMEQIRIEVKLKGIT